MKFKEDRENFFRCVTNSSYDKHPANCNYIIGNGMACLSQLSNCGLLKIVKGITGFWNLG